MKTITTKLDVSGTHPGAPLMRVVQTCERHGGLNGSDPSPESVSTRSSMLARRQVTQCLVEYPKRKVDENSTT